MAALIRWYPHRALATRRPFDMLGEFETLVRGLWDSWQPAVFGSDFHPSLNMYEDKDELVVKAELPGVDKEGLDISLDGDILHLRAEKKEEREETDEETKYYAYERRFGSYSRSVSLPYHVDAGKASATFKDGVLELRLPKAEEIKAQHINIEPKTKKAKAARKAKKSKAKHAEAKT